MRAGQFAIRTQPRGAYSNHSKERSGCSRIATKTPLWLSGRGVARRLHKATCRLSIIPSANSHAFRVNCGISGHFAPATPIPASLGQGWADTQSEWLKDSGRKVGLGPLIVNSVDQAWAAVTKDPGQVSLVSSTVMSNYRQHGTKRAVVLQRSVDRYR
jgi:hypothetical protein